MADAWRDLSDLPRDATILIVVVPSASNATCRGAPPATHAAYVDCDGRLCCPGTWEPNSGFHGEFWQTVLWQPMPAPRAIAKAEGRS